MENLWSIRLSQLEHNLEEQKNSFVCPRCGKGFEKKASLGGHLSYCGKDCTERKKKHSLRMRGENNPFFGKQHTTDFCDSHSKFMEAKWSDPEYKQKNVVAHIGKVNPNKGKTYEEIYGVERASELRVAVASYGMQDKHHTEETKQQMRVSQEGVSFDARFGDRADELKEKYHNLYTDKPQSPETVAKRVAKNTGKKRTPTQRQNIAAGVKARGYKHTDEAKQKMALSKQGTVPINKGKHNADLYGEEKAQELFDVASKNSKANWQSPDYVRKQMRSRHTFPNKAEIFLTAKLQEWLPGEYKYNGCPGADGGMILAGKVPDFINVNGQKKIIELFGEQFHAPEEEQQRKEIFKPYGWSTLVIWGKELRNLKALKEKVMCFNEKAKEN